MKCDLSDMTSGKKSLCQALHNHYIFVYAGCYTGNPKPGHPHNHVPDATDVMYTKCHNGMHNQVH